VQESERRERIADLYELQEDIAHGGQGRIVRARDRRDGRIVAIKTLHDAWAADRSAVERLDREADALEALSGTSAVALLGRGHSEAGAPCLVMEFLEGIDLETELSKLEARSERMDTERLASLVEPVVATLDVAHQKRLYHRDLKPANWFLLTDGSVRLIDFGFVHVAEASRVTHFDTVMGSPCYIAPEVWLGGSSQVDGRADCYSLAVILYRILGGHPPFEHASLSTLSELVTRSKRPSLCALRPELPPALDGWVEKALAINPSDRYPTICETWEALGAALNSAGPSPWRRLGRSVMDSLRPSRFTTAFLTNKRRAPAGLLAPPPPRWPRDEIVDLSDDVAPLSERNALLPTLPSSLPPAAQAPVFREARQSRLPSLAERRNATLRRRNGWKHLQASRPRGRVRKALK
jgi:serine/threonine-protein kinase